jgi:hypothetical protein
MAVEEDLALKEMIEPTAREAEELSTATKVDKKEQLYNISRTLAVLASASVWPESRFFLLIFNPAFLEKKRERKTYINISGTFISYLAVCCQGTPRVFRPCQQGGMISSKTECLYASVFIS